MQLWLRIFTASSTQLREDYFLFSNGPSNKAGAARDGICRSYNRVDLAHYDPIALTLTDVTELAVWGTILGTNVHDPVGKTITATTTLHNQHVAPRRPTKNRTVSLKCSIYDSSNSIPLDFTIVTPIRVDALEGALCGHSNSSFVLKLCSDLRFGARLGYDGPRMSRFSKNLKSAIDNQNIVSTNLAKEVSLGHTAGPFTNPPFANLLIYRFRRLAYCT